MNKIKLLLVGFGFALAAGTQEQPLADIENHSNCSFFGAEREKKSAEVRNRFWRGKLTAEVTSFLEKPGYSELVPNGTRTSEFRDSASASPIDSAIFGELAKKSITPAEKTNDFEFVRRVTLDLTGRVPTADAVIAFTGNQSETKRAELVDRLLQSPEWVDKWTMYFGDMYRNTRTSDVLPRFDQGRNAFYTWIKASLQANKSYNRMASELIAAKATNSFEQGEGNFILGSKTSGGPPQDDYDQEAADVVSTFLGISHLNCILCHPGRGHLDTLSLWGKTARRSDAWGMAAYFGKLNLVPTRPDPANNNLRYYSLVDNAARADYGLNTVSGNRPPRQPTDGLGATVKPKYMFGTESAKSGENYREAFARAITNDFQFSRATVNYLWGALMGRGLVEPMDQFDPARLDPDNPPTGGWTLQPSNAALLNTLADQFINNGYDLKWLMRTIVNSETYQLSSRYTGEWNVSDEPTFARHLVRRLMAEEIHDAIATTSNILPTYNVSAPNGPTYGDRNTYPVRFAMQLPETGTLPDNGTVAAFLNSFARGNRNDDDRKGDGSAIQALNLMNDAFVMNRIRSSNAGGQQSLLNKYIALADAQLVNQLYLTVLSRYPSPAELASATKTLQGTSGNARVQKGENLMWVLYNKVDFIYNY